MLGMLLFLTALTFASLYLYFRQVYSYWKKRGVPCLNPKPPLGDLGAVMFSSTTNPWFHTNEMYRLLEGERVGGLYRFNNPTLMVRDPELIKDMMVKQFDRFHGRGIHTNDKKEPLEGNLFNISGTKWRNLRSTLSPTFTSGKMKMMFPTVVEIGRQLQEVVASSHGQDVEIKGLLSRFSTDIIASCAFGVQCNCLKNPEAEFRTWGRRVFTLTLKTYIFTALTFLLPELAKHLRFSLVSKEVSKYFRQMVRDTVNFREKNGVHRNDFMELLIQLKNRAPEENDTFEVTMDVIAAQAFGFFAAGFDTTSSAMTFCLYELALNPDIQDRLWAEIDSNIKKHGGELTYEGLLEMEYLDKVLQEAMRKYPPGTVILRECTQTTRLGDTDIIVEKGTMILFPVMGLHNDPKYFPEPNRFDPERFSEEEKKKRPHYCYMPFGEGPRMCIAMRFALMQAKVALISIISDFVLQVSEKTPVPLEYEPRSLVLCPKGGLWLKVMKRT